jgi:hypothetical protein
MFWNRRKPPQMDQTPSLLALASKLGVERRLNVRVRYPNNVRVCRLPEVAFEGHELKVQNISVGGCAVLDPIEYLGPSVGLDIKLTLHWSTVAEAVNARIVSRVDHRRHVQFLNLSSGRQGQLIKSMTFGVRALSMVKHAHPSELGPSIEAVELWSSAHHDSLIVETDVHRLAQLFVNGDQYVIYREAWPKRAKGAPCSRLEFEQLILFLANIPVPSPAVMGLLSLLEQQIVLGGEP